MMQNVGNPERVVRVLAGVAICAAGFYYQSWWGLVGLAPIATGSLGYCPPYQLLGINTCGMKKTDGAAQ